LYQADLASVHSNITFKHVGAVDRLFTVRAILTTATLVLESRLGVFRCALIRFSYNITFS